MVTHARKPIIIASDLAADSRAAIRYGARLAETLNRPLKIVNVVARGPQSDQLRLSADAAHDSEIARQALQSIAASVRMSDPRLEVSGEIDIGNPCDRLVWHSGHAAILVMGARGRDSYPYRWGSTSENVASRAFCPVLVIRSEWDRSPHPVNGAVVAEAESGTRPDGSLAHASRVAAALADAMGVELVEVLEADGRRCDATRLVHAADDNDAAMVVIAETRPDRNGSLVVRELIERTDRPVLIVHRHDALD